jgi:hypothetical protein
MTEKPENAGQKQGGKFKPGQSGNPAGKPKGCRHKATRAVMELLDGQAEKITQKAVSMALAGDTTALRLVLERIVPPRKDAPITLELPKLESAEDATRAVADILEAVGRGELTPSEGQTLTAMIEAFRKNLETQEIEKRLRKLEEEAERGKTH